MRGSVIGLRRYFAALMQLYTLENSFHFGRWFSITFYDLIFASIYACDVRSVFCDVICLFGGGGVGN